MPQLLAWLDVPKSAREITGGGAQLSFDALGSPAICFNSVANLRRRSRPMRVVPTLEDHATPAIPTAQVIAHELENYGSHDMQA